uniref:Oxysterol binding protein like 2 n=1 Tax=Myotis myotis TaxID=51298 RepID=A0A7J7T2Q1_MYOMY|nr:hypothetical protein mMyoMyo1_000113 [Myotis myotis]
MEEQVLGEIPGDCACGDSERESAQQFPTEKGEAVELGRAGRAHRRHLMQWLSHFFYHDSQFGDHFEWNKVTSCIHNILSGQRWIEHYGEVLIRNTKDSSCHCKITFCKAKYWSSNIHEVQGAVFSRSGRVLHRLFGKWNEGLYRGPLPGGQCIWKPNSMPPDHERNFGFTQFALELNELTAELKRSLPSTDTRLRPDQRYLEEGNIQAAEAQKRRIEQLQRDRRRVMEENNIVHQARFFRRQTDGSGKEWWVTNNTYWRLRAEPGYGNLDGAVLW